MKTLLLANQKGGVGKSAVATQFAHYLTDKLGLRVVVVDLDHQANTTKALKASGLASISDTPASAVLATKTATVESAELVLIPSDAELSKLERQHANHNAFAANLMGFLARIGEQFDVCIIDTNPNPDIRVVASLVAADFVLSPIELNQEAIDGIGALLRDVRNIQAKLNPKLTLVGILPNKVAPTPFQRGNFEQLAQHFGKLLIPLGKNSYALVKTSTAIAEAQAEGKPLWKLGKTSARDAWRDIEPTFKKIADTLGVTK